MRGPPGHERLTNTVTQHPWETIYGRRGWTTLANCSQNPDSLCIWEKTVLGWMHKFIRYSGE